MTETSHTRSRRASLYGLLLQLLVFLGALGLAQVSDSQATLALAWYLAGGLPLWFVCVLMYRQHELVALEALDLEELRREKRSAGGSEAMFDEEGGGALGFRVAEARLRWMQSWLMPAFGLISAAYLASVGLWLWHQASSLGPAGRGPLMNLPIAMIILAVMMVVLFLYSRYASGMGRAPQWQHLRACGSYMLGNAVAALALIVCLGVYLYAEVATAERVLAFALPVVMLVLSAETLVNFILDAYRPRTRGVEARACFDSRLLALIAEPGGIASTIAEAINYQFGFEVSQTWFYQLLQRTFIPLIGAGAVILWLLTCLLVVQPGESAIIERLGRQLNAERPCQPGFYWKLPWPIDVARKYNTGRLHQIIVGFKQFDAEPKDEGKTVVALWDDEKHLGQPHFNFLVPVPARGRSPTGGSAESAPQPSAARRSEQALPVNIVRMDMALQYKIRDDRLAAYTGNMFNPDDLMRDIAWEEVVRYTASKDIFTLLGPKYGTAGTELEERIRRRVADLDLGLDVVYVGMQNIHPEPGVSKEFRKVVTAEQEKVGAIREALVKENEVLSAVAGSRDTARELAQAVGYLGPATTLRDQSELLLATADSALIGRLQEQLKALAPQLRRVTETRWLLGQAQQEKRQVDTDVDLGLGRDFADQARAVEKVAAAEAELTAAEQALSQAWTPIQSEAAPKLSPAIVAALKDHAQARVALDFWNGQLARLLPDLQGQAAAILAAAQAQRWTIEMAAAAEVARVQGERQAYRAAPNIYKIRKYLEVLVNGIKDSRKFFLAFDPGGRTVRVRFMAEEQARPDIQNMETRRKP